MTVGDRIRDRRIELGITQEELAKRMGYKSKAAICKAEKEAENMTSDRVSKFANALSCSEKYLMGWEESNLGIESGELSAIVAVDQDLQEMITIYLTLSEEKKAHVRSMVKLLSQQ